MRTALLVLVLLAPFLCSAQSVSTFLGARQAGFGNATTVLQDEWAFFSNPAGIATEKKISVATAYEVRPQLPGANRMGLTGVAPMQLGVGGIGVFRFGDDVYSEQLVSLGWAHSIGKTSLGLRLSYLQYRALGFGTHSALGINVGGITQITPTLVIGAWIQNINQPKLNFADAEKAPVKLMAALGFKPNEQFLIVSEIEKDVLSEPLWKTGMEYWVHKKLAARVGFNLNPEAAFFGVGYKTWRIKIDYAFQSFSVLGPSHQASASYQINAVKKKKS